MPKGGSVNQIESSDLTTTSFGELSRLPSKRSRMTVIAPSYSVRVTRRPSCSQVTSRPWRSRVLPFEWLDGLRKTAQRAGFFVPAHDAIVGDVAPQQIAAVAEPYRPLGPAEPGGEPLDRGVERRLDRVEARIEGADRRVGIALRRFPAAGDRAGSPRRSTGVGLDPARTALIRSTPDCRRRTATGTKPDGHRYPSGSFCPDLPYPDRQRPCGGRAIVRSPFPRAALPALPCSGRAARHRRRRCRRRAAATR